jgi:hypothetical protein
MGRLQGRTPGVDLDMRDQPGEFLLARAVFDRLIEDARHPRPLSALDKNPGGRTTIVHQLAAIETLVDPHGGANEWAELLGLDGQAVRSQLLREAGLSDFV